MVTLVTTVHLPRGHQNTVVAIKRKDLGVSFNHGLTSERARENAVMVTGFIGCDTVCELKHWKRVKTRKKVTGNPFSAHITSQRFHNRMKNSTLCNCCSCFSSAYIPLVYVMAGKSSGEKFYRVENGKYCRTINEHE